MTISVIILLIMLAAIGAIAGYRKLVAKDEDDFIHVNDPTGQIAAHQQHTAQSLNAIDRVEKILSVVTVVYGVALLAVYMYRGLVSHGQF